MKLRACLLLVAVSGCAGLIKVNGKSVGGGSPSSGSSSSSSSSSGSSSSDGEGTDSRDVDRQREKDYDERAKKRQAELDAEHKKDEEEEAKRKAAEPKELDDNGKHLQDFKNPPTKQAAWTPLYQYAGVTDRHGEYTAMIKADELGDKLSQAGRLGLIEECFKDASKDVNAASVWASCGADVETFDMNALAKELKKEGLSAKAQKSFLDDAAETLGRAKEIGAAVMTAAKDDAGVAAVVDMGKTARSEWSTYASAHATELAELDAMQDLVRENKNGQAGDCVAKTKPAMEKAAKAAKWRENDTPVFPAEFYVNLMPDTTDAFIATLRWAACAALVHESGKILYSSAEATSYGYSTYSWRRFHRRGPRTLTVAKIYAEGFKPKFAHRDIQLSSFREPKGSYGEGLMKTPHDAKIAKLTKKGDETTIAFSKDKVSVCANWVDTNKIQSVSSSGDISYEKKCTSREWVDNEYDDITTSSEFTDGLTPGVELEEEWDFPVIGTKNGKFVAALGVKL